MNNKIILVSVIGALVIGIAVMFFGFKDDDTLSAADQHYTVTNVATTSTANTHQATISYSVPAPEQNVITVNVTVDNGVVTAVDAQNVTNSPQSQQYSARFLANYKTEVVGKKLSDVSLSRVGGASLTSKAFNAAIDAIKTQVG